MNQKESKENLNPNETSTEATEENFNPLALVTDLSEKADDQEIDNLPIESIGSYARIEELLTDEEKENKAGKE